MSLPQEVEKPPPYTKATESGRAPTASTQPPAVSDAQERSAISPTKPASHPSISTNYRSPANGLSSPDKKIFLQPVSMAIDPSLSQHQIRGPADGDTVMSMDVEPTQDRRDPSSSIEDPDDRMAAEALYSLGKTDTSTSSHTATVPPSRTPTGYTTPLKYYPTDHQGISDNDGEPLLSLLTSSHPWLGGTLGGSLSAYSSTKSYTPRFIQYGADIVENTVGNVGRRTGVEEGLRRYLGGRPSPQGSLEHHLTQGKVQLHNDAMDLESGPSVTSSAQGPGVPIQRKPSHADSVDTLPAYDSNRSPSYQEATASPNASTSTAVTSARRPQIPRSWSTQLMISTSGLGAALNETSLRSLKFCLGFLSNANKHVRNLSEALKQLLQAFDTHARKIRKSRSPEDGDVDMADAATSSEQQAADNEEAKRIAEKIKQLNAEIWRTLKNVVNSVSRYTGGALPENASVIVRWQLMSVPGRWQKAVSKADQSSATEGGASTAEPNGKGKANDQDDAIGAANRMLNFAIEGLDMMEQVGGVVDSTITSAERWLERMGKGKEREGAVSGTVPETIPEQTEIAGPSGAPQASSEAQAQGEDEKMTEEV
ncbi:MAG: hypothetical protein M1828_005033 [Chrysothrix sp. TS-e1954]|nr:MAG: hypothetical protein M1828_005033 [Chrysothrix sp. TS-e1954]